MKITIPNKLTLKHVNLIASLNDLEDVPAQEMINFVADFCNVHRNDVERSDFKSLQELYYTLIDLFNDVKGYEKPKEKITVNGQVYTLREISNNHPASWWVTAQKELAKGIQSHQVMALCYIEEGMQFNDFDEKHQRIILNPYKYRCNVFEGAELIKEYLPLQGFFLEKYNRYKSPFLSLQRIRKHHPQLLKTLLNHT